ncbi:MAG TPA: ABC transporter substrate-binding protein [Phototrophicaceae bacterium]|nr:ABC transporter substrate-binding protein [Phototrophicaceae bacterium]
MVRKWVFLVLLLLVLAPAALEAQPSGLPVDVPRNQVFVADQILQYTDVDNFNMWVSSTTTPNRHAMLMDTLWYSDAETGQRVYGAAVSDPVYNSDFTEMTVKLRDNIYWSDGVQFNADDLVYTVQTIMANPKLDSWYAPLHQWVKSVEKVDDYTVKFTLTAPNPRFHYYFEARWNGVYMMPKHVFEKVTDPLETYKFNPPVSLGAYTFQQGDPNGFWDLYKLRDDWQRTSVGITVGQPGPQYILTIFYGDSTKKAIAMTRGDLDVAFDFDYEAFESLLQSDPTARSWYKDFPWAYPNEIDSRYLAFNYQKDPLFQNEDVRWALTLATDIVDLQTNYIGGVAKVTAMAQPATAALSKLYYDPMKDWLEGLTINTPNDPNYKPFDDTVPDQIASWAQDQGYTVSGSAADEFGIGWWKHDTDTAEALLTKNGFKRDSDGNWLTPDGQPWKIDVLAPNDEPDAFRIANAIQDQWKAFGIDATADGVVRSVWTQRTNSGDFDIEVPWGNYNLSLANGDKWLNIDCLRSNYFVPMPDNYNSKGGCNDMRLQNIPGLDDLIDKMTNTDPQSQDSITEGQDFLKMFTQNMYVIPVVTFKKFITWDSRYWTGFPTAEDPTVFPEYWFQIGKFTYAHLKPAQASS